MNRLPVRRRNLNVIASHVGWVVQPVRFAHLGISSRCCRYGMIRAVRWARVARSRRRGAGCGRGAGFGPGGC
jgi:hypothetical protein